MSKNSDMKAAFRATPEWKAFRDIKKAEQNGKDYLTRMPLRKGWNLHHIIQDPEQYTNIDHHGHFRCLNKKSHDVVHFCLTQIKKDGDLGFLERLYDEIVYEAIENGYVTENEI